MSLQELSFTLAEIITDKGILLSKKLYKQITYF